jgi:cyclic pyranopterin phosphate synthase
LARMVYIGGKPSVERRAVAEGRILLGKATLDAIRRREIKKGDVFSASQLAGIQAAKRCPDIVPLCHPVPLTSIDVSLDIQDGSVNATCEVRANYRTGVEMEALCGVAGALLCVWDMVKYLEKDDTGNYPSAAISGIRVLSKEKGEPGAGEGTKRKITGRRKSSRR